MCSLCLTYRQGDDETKIKLKDRYEKHNFEKMKLQELKEESKAQACQNKIHYAQFSIFNRSSTCLQVAKIQFFTRAVCLIFILQFIISPLQNVSAFPGTNR